eukprot:g608.t1
MGKSEHERLEMEANWLLDQDEEEMAEHQRRTGTGKVKRRRQDKTSSWDKLKSAVAKSKSGNMPRAMPVRKGSLEHTEKDRILAQAAMLEDEKRRSRAVRAGESIVAAAAAGPATAGSSDEPAKVDSRSSAMGSILKKAMGMANRVGSNIKGSFHMPAGASPGAAANGSAGKVAPLSAQAAAQEAAAAVQADMDPAAAGRETPDSLGADAQVWRTPGGTQRFVNQEDIDPYRQTQEEDDPWLMAKKKQAAMLLKYNRGVLFKEERVIHPDTKQLRSWNGLMFACVCYSAIAVPLVMGFQINRSVFQQWIDGLIELWFLADIGLNFHTGYVDPHTTDIVLDLHKIRRHYLTGWFLIDTAGSVPVEIITAVAGSVDDLMFLKVLRLTKVFRLVRLMRLRLLDDMENQGWVNPSLMRLVKLVGSFLLIIHFITCAYWGVVVLEGPHAVHIKFSGVGAPGASSSSWSGSYADHLLQWLPDQDMFDSDIGRRYLYSMHWAMLALLGSDTIPQSNTELWFTNGMLLLGVVVFASIVGSASSLLSSLDAYAEAKKTQMDSVKQYLRYRRVPTTLQRKICNYFEYLWVSGQSIHHKRLFDELPESLSLMLNLSLKRKLIENCPMFRECSAVSVVAVIRRLIPCIAMPEEMLARQGDRGDRMFFVVRGALQVFIAQPNGERVVVNSLGEGAQFGEVALLSENAERTASVVALTFCELEQNALMLRKSTAGAMWSKVTLTARIANKLKKVVSNDAKLGPSAPKKGGSGKAGSFRRSGSFKGRQPSMKSLGGSKGKRGSLPKKADEVMEAAAATLANMSVGTTKTNRSTSEAVEAMMTAAMRRRPSHVGKSKSSDEKRRQSLNGADSATEAQMREMVEVSQKEASSRARKPSVLGPGLQEGNGGRGDATSDCEGGAEPQPPRSPVQRPRFSSFPARKQTDATAPEEAAVLYRLLLRAARDHDRRPVLKSLLATRREMAFCDGEWSPIHASNIDEVVDSKVESMASHLFSGGVFYRPAEPTPINVVDVVQNAWRSGQWSTSSLDVAMAGLRVLEGNAGLGEALFGLARSHANSEPHASNDAPLKAVTRLAELPAARQLHGATSERWLHGKVLCSQPLLGVVPPMSQQQHDLEQAMEEELGNGDGDVVLEMPVYATYRTVLLVCHTDQHGALGLVLNCPAGFRLRELLDADAQQRRGPDSNGAEAGTGISASGDTYHDYADVLQHFLDHEVMVGGPVSPRSLMLLHRSSGRVHYGELNVTGDVRFTASLDGVRAALASGAAAPGEYRLFMGYAGWAPGQLQGECDSNTWFVGEGETAVEQLVSAPVRVDMRDELWGGAMRRFGGEYVKFAQVAALDGASVPETVRVELLNRGLGLGLCFNSNAIDMSPATREDREADLEH